jgi:hypothetical protein
VFSLSSSIYELTPLDPGRAKIGGRQKALTTRFVLEVTQYSKLDGILLPQRSTITNTTAASQAAS